MSNKTEAQSRTRDARERVDAAIKELEAAKAALAASEQEPASGRTVMKPSEVPVGEYFRFVDKEYDIGRLQARMSDWHYASFGSPVCPRNIQRCHDKPVYLTDPYGNAIEPCEELPGGFVVGNAVWALRGKPYKLSGCFRYTSTGEGPEFWRAQEQGLSPSAAAKLRGMIHKWNQENGGRG